jgi:hypothetical protein
MIIFCDICRNIDSRLAELFGVELAQGKGWKEA